MKRILLVSSIALIGYASAHATCVTKCADDYELSEEEAQLLELCDNSPDYETCRCILVRTFCVPEHKGATTESDFYQVEIETFCAVAEYLRERLTEEQWREVAESMEEEGLVCIE
ncbi:hypothetical protein JW872_00775 [Candidatus Babeliales bacterium]|nr:hypothetical protein [Candidatus Babeliales bacterium]